MVIFYHIPLKPFGERNQTISFLDLRHQLHCHLAIISWSVLWCGCLEQRSYKTWLPKSHAVLASAFSTLSLVICTRGFFIYDKFFLSQISIKP
jgi:hypothetical protein